MKPLTQNIKEALKVAVMALTITLGVTYVYAAWTGPTVAPPGGNVDAPINVGTVDQIKDGGLGIDSLAVYGNSSVSGYMNLGDYIKLGTTTVVCDSSIEGALRYNSTSQSLEFCNASAWGQVSVSEGIEYLIGGRAAQGCTDVGGELFETGDGKICKMIASSCPGGWAQYENWSETTGGHCGNSNCGGGAVCDTSSHSWGNIAQETCNSIGDGPGSYYCTNFGTRCACAPNTTCYAAFTKLGCY